MKASGRYRIVCRARRMRGPRAADPRLRVRPTRFGGGARGLGPRAGDGGAGVCGDHDVALHTSDERESGKPLIKPNGVGRQARRRPGSRGRRRRPRRRRRDDGGRARRSAPRPRGGGGEDVEQSCARRRACVVLPDPPREGSGRRGRGGGGGAGDQPAGRGQDAAAGAGGAGARRAPPRPPFTTSEGFSAAALRRHVQGVAQGAGGRRAVRGRVPPHRHREHRVAALPARGTGIHIPRSYVLAVFRANERSRVLLFCCSCGDLPSRLGC